MKHRAAFEVPAAIAPQMKWIEQEVAAQKALATLAGPVATVAEQWHRYNEDARRVAENITTAQAGYEANFVSAMDHAAEKISAAYTGYGAKTINVMEVSMSKAQEQVMANTSARNEMLKDVDLDAQRAMAKVSGADAWQEELRRRNEWEAELRRREDIARGTAMPGSAAYGTDMGDVDAMRRRQQDILYILPQPYAYSGQAQVNTRGRRCRSVAAPRGATGRRTAGAERWGTRAYMAGSPVAWISATSEQRRMPPCSSGREISSRH